MNKMRLIVSIICGMILGVICIIGGSQRAGGFSGNEIYLIAMWYNRVIIGLVIGFADRWLIINNPANRYIRGGLLGFLVSGAFFLSTNFKDPTAFIAGIVYGLIIEFVLWLLFERN